MDLHTTGDVSGDGEMDMSYMEEDEDSDDGEDELELEYDFEDDIGEELDYFVDMPWSSYIGTLNVYTYVLYTVYVISICCTLWIS